MDRDHISCESCRNAVSAALDDEDLGASAAAVHAHLATCADCRMFEADARVLHRTVRVTPAPAVPDLTPRILGALGDVMPANGGTSASHRDAWRAGLALVATVQILLAVPALVLGSDAGLPVHTARHLGSFAVALGVGFLVVAWKPNRAPGLFPLAAALVACLVLTSIVDVANGRTAALGELSHSTELLGLALCWLVGRSSAPEPRDEACHPGTGMRTRNRFTARALLVTLLAAGIVAIVASPASAHAELLRSTPAPGAVLDRAPTTVKLDFTEGVEVQGGAIRVFDADGQRVDNGGVESDGRTVTLPLPDLENGSYVVTWRVTSADSHPIRGAFTFQVGQGGAGATSRQVQGLADRLLAQQGGDRIVGVLSGIARFLMFGGLALLIGGAFFALMIWPPARASKAAKRVVQGGWLAVVVASVAGLLLYGPYVEGLGLGDSFTTNLLGDTLGTRFGQVWLARLVLLLAVTPVLFLLFRRDPETGEPRPLPRWWSPAMAAMAVVLALTPGVAGHATAGDWATAAIVADTIHVLAMAIWLGGLVVLALVTLSRGAPLSARDAVERFSRVALACIIALVVTGAFQTWRQVGSLEALRSTDYGRILVVKLVLVAVVIVFAAFSREVVLRILPPPPSERTGGVPVVAGGSDDDPDDGEYEIDEEMELRRLRRSVWAEIATAALILVVTALLVNAAPAKTAVASAGGVAGVTLRGDGVNVDVTLTPAVAGSNDVHVDVSDASGSPKDVQELTVAFSLPSRGIAPIDVPLRRLGPGHYLSPGFEVPISGEWRVRAKPLLSEFDEQTLRGSIDVG